MALSTSTKRGWVYAGLGYPEGVVLARRASDTPRLTPGSSFVMVGDEHASSLAQYLGRLANDSKVNLRYEWQRAQPFENWFTPDRAEKLLVRQPTLALFVFNSKSADPAEIQPRLKELKRYLGATPVCWVLPPTVDPGALALALATGAEGIPAFHSESLELHRSPTGSPSARGYAGWAGAVWGWIR